MQMYTPKPIRTIQDLYSVELSNKNPWPKAKLKGPQLQGIRYERSFGKYLIKRQEAGAFPGTLHLGQWFYYGDSCGTGMAQPDAYVVGETSILLFECKLSYTPIAWPQLRDLYKPILEFHYELPVACIQVCRNVSAAAEGHKIIHRSSGICDNVVWHWRR
jgi:hypothetical protein